MEQTTKIISENGGRRWLKEVMPTSDGLPELVF